MGPIEIPWSMGTMTVRLELRFMIRSIRILLPKYVMTAPPYKAKKAVKVFLHGPLK
jgi:hypothetical protein